MNGRCEVLFSPSFEGQNPAAASRASRLLSYKHPAPVSPLECALTEFPVTVHSKRLTQQRRSFRMRSYEKTGGRGPTHFPPSYSKFTPKGTAAAQSPTLFRIFFQVPYAPTPLFSHSSQNCRGVGHFFFTQGEAKGPFRNESGTGILACAFPFDRKQHSKCCGVECTHGEVGRI